RRCLVVRILIGAIAGAKKPAGLAFLSGARRVGEPVAWIAAEGLQRTAKSAEDAGVTLVLELLNSKVDHHGYQCDWTAWGVAVCEAVNTPRVKLLYDVLRMRIMEGDIIRMVRQNIVHIGNFHRPVQALSLSTWCDSAPSRHFFLPS